MSPERVSSPKLRKIILGSVVVLLVLSSAITFYFYKIDLQERNQQYNAILDRGIGQYHEKRYSESLQTLENIPSGVITTWQLPYYKASALVQLKKYKPAATYLEKALALNNSEKIILSALGVVYYKLGNLRLAKGYFSSTLELDPGNEHVKGLMDIMARLQRQSEAELKETDQTEEL